MAAVNTKTAVIVGEMGGVKTEMLLDSGSSVSLVQEGLLLQNSGVTRISPATHLELVTASGEKLKVVDHILAPVHVSEVYTNHEFVVVNRLVAPVILGVDFLQKNSLVLDFSSPQVEVRKTTKQNQQRGITASEPREEWEKIYGSVREERARDVDAYCRQCTTCQQAKLPSPTRAPPTNVPIGRPWEMIAVDILEVPVSCNNNRYLLVVQDYFTKWATAIPLQDQTAARIVKELVKLFSEFGVPRIVHSDQGRNFESTILRQTMEAFGVTNISPTQLPITHKGMEWWSV